MIKSYLWSTENGRLMAALILIHNACVQHNAGMFWEGIKYDAKKDRYYTIISLHHTNVKALRFLIVQAERYLRS